MGLQDGFLGRVYVILCKLLWTRHLGLKMNESAIAGLDCANNQ